MAGSFDSYRTGVLTFADVLGRRLKSYYVQAFDSKRHHLNTGVGEARASVKHFAGSAAKASYPLILLHIYRYTGIQIYRYISGAILGGVSVLAGKSVPTLPLANTSSLHWQRCKYNKILHFYRCGKGLMELRNS